MYTVTRDCYNNGKRTFSKEYSFKDKAAALSEAERMVMIYKQIENKVAYKLSVAVTDEKTDKTLFFFWNVD